MQADLEKSLKKLRQSRYSAKILKLDLLKEAR